MRRSLINVSAAALFVVGAMAGAVPAHALLFDQDITPDVIFGGGNANGGWTVDQSNGIEVGLRAKVRYDVVTNGPLDVFNSNGDGTYNHAVGAPVAPEPATRARWNFGWSINTDYMDSSGNKLSDFTYLLEMDFDPGVGVSFESLDPIFFLPLVDNSLGTNATGNGAGLEAPGDGDYATLLTTSNVAQNSWNLDFFDEFFTRSFDPTVDGLYDFRLSIIDLNETPLAVVAMQVIVGAGASVPEPASLGLLGVGLAGLFGLRRRKKP